MNPIQTLREALEAMSDGKYPETMKVAIAALAELEKQEPVAWMYDWLPAGGPTAYDWVSGNKAEVFAPENCYFNIRPLYAAPVAQQYEAGDMASAAAQGFRDGVTSVAKQPHECTRSHPHENMDGFCVLRTEIARLTNENARVKALLRQASLHVASNIAVASGDSKAEDLYDAIKGELQ